MGFCDVRSSTCVGFASGGLNYFLEIFQHVHNIFCSITRCAFHTYICGKQQRKNHGFSNGANGEALDAVSARMAKDRSAFASLSGIRSNTH